MFDWFFKKNNTSKIGLSQFNNFESSDDINVTVYNADFYYDKGNEFFDNEDYDKAIEYFSKAINLETNNSNFYNDRGLAFYYKEDNESAKRDFDKALELNPNNHYSYYNRGRVYRDGYSDFNKAIADLKEAIKLKSDNSEYYFTLADTYSRISNLEETVKHYGKAYELDPKEHECLIRMAAYELNLAKKNMDILNVEFSIIKQLDEYIEKQPDDSRGYFYRGDALHFALRNMDAIKDFLKVLELEKNEDDNDTFWLIGHCYFREGNYKACITYLTKAINAYNKDSRYFLFRGISYQHIGENVKAIEDLKKALLFNKDSASAYLYLGLAYKELEDNNAIDNLEKSLEMGIKSMEHIAHFALGDIYIKEKQYEKAIYNFTKVIEYIPNAHPAFFKRGMIYTDVLRQYDKAILDLEKAISLNSDNKIYFHYCGYAYAHKGDIDSRKDFQLALSEYDKAIEMYKIAHKLEWGNNNSEKAKFSYDSTVGYAQHCKESLLSQNNEIESEDVTINFKEETDGNFNLNDIFGDEDLLNYSDDEIDDDDEIEYQKGIEDGEKDGYDDGYKMGFAIANSRDVDFEVRYDILNSNSSNFDYNPYEYGYRNSYSEFYERGFQDGKIAPSSKDYDYEEPAFDDDDNEYPESFKLWK